MAIRIRIINGLTVALCAAKTSPEKSDLYLDDNIHHALSSKFGVDFYEMGFLRKSCAEDNLVALMREQEQTGKK